MQGSYARRSKMTFSFPNRGVFPWFFHHCLGSLAICYLPQNLLHDKTWIGLELYVSFTWRLSNSIDEVPSFLLVDLQAHGQSILFEVTCPIVINSCFGSQQLLVFHAPRELFPRLLNQCQGISALFRASTPNVDIEVCGSRLLYEQDLESLIQAKIECTLATRHALRMMHFQAQNYVEAMHQYSPGPEIMDLNDFEEVQNEFDGTIEW